MLINKYSLWTTAVALLSFLVFISPLALAIYQEASKSLHIYSDIGSRQTEVTPSGDMVSAIDRMQGSKTGFRKAIKVIIRNPYNGNNCGVGLRAASESSAKCEKVAAAMLRSTACQPDSADDDSADENLKAVSIFCGVDGDLHMVETFEFADSFESCKLNPKNEKELGWPAGGAADCVYGEHEDWFKKCATFAMGVDGGSEYFKTEGWNDVTERQKERNACLAMNPKIGYHTEPASAITRYAVEGGAYKGGAIKAIIRNPYNGDNCAVGLPTDGNAFYLKCISVASFMLNRNECKPKPADDPHLKTVSIFCGPNGDLHMVESFEFVGQTCPGKSSWPPNGAAYCDYDAHKKWFGDCAKAVATEAGPNGKDYFAPISGTADYSWNRDKTGRQSLGSSPPCGAMNPKMSF